MHRNGWPARPKSNLYKENTMTRQERIKLHSRRAGFLFRNGYDKMARVELGLAKRARRRGKTRKRNL